MLIWLSIIPLAILNGGLRENVLLPLLGAQWAQPLSGLILCLLICAVSVLFIPKIGKGEAKTYWKIGLLWVFLTFAFESTFGLARGNSLCEIMKAYNITSGNLWLVVLIFIGIAPYLAAKIRRIL